MVGSRCRSSNIYTYTRKEWRRLSAACCLPPKDHFDHQDESDRISYSVKSCFSCKEGRSSALIKDFRAKTRSATGGAARLKKARVAEGGARERLKRTRDERSNRARRAVTTGAQQNTCRNPTQYAKCVKYIQFAKHFRSFRVK